MQKTFRMMKRQERRKQPRMSSEVGKSLQSVTYKRAVRYMEEGAETV